MALENTPLSDGASIWGMLRVVRCAVWVGVSLVMVMVRPSYARHCKRRDYDKRVIGDIA